MSPGLVDLVALAAVCIGAWTVYYRTGKRWLNR